MHDFEQKTKPQNSGANVLMIIAIRARHAQHLVPIRFAQPLFIFTAQFLYVTPEKYPQQIRIVAVNMSLK